MNPPNVGEYQAVVDVALVGVDIVLANLDVELVERRLHSTHFTEMSRMQSRKETDDELAPMFHSSYLLHLLDL